MGEINDKLERIGLLFCIDGIPAFKYKVLLILPHRQRSFVCCVEGTIVDARRVSHTFLTSVAAIQGKQHPDESANSRTSLGTISTQVF